MNTLRGCRLSRHQYICHISKSSITCTELTLLSVAAGTLTAAARCWQHSPHCTSHSRSPSQHGKAASPPFPATSTAPERALPNSGCPVTPVRGKHCLGSHICSEGQNNGPSGAIQVQAGRAVGRTGAHHGSEAAEHGDRYPQRQAPYYCLTSNSLTTTAPYLRHIVSA